MNPPSPILEPMVLPLSEPSMALRLPTVAQPAELLAELERTIQGIASYILSTADYERNDRLWPSSPEVFGTNPLSVGYGACGVAVFLQAALGEIPVPVRDWMMRQPLNTDRYAPGFLVGVSGVARSFLRLGWIEEAEAAMRTAYSSPLLYERPDLMMGAAGWGMASLDFFAVTGGQEYVHRAIDAGEHLLRTAREEEDGWTWSAEGADRIHYGYGYGAAGVALFLGHLARTTGDVRYLEAAERGLAHDYAKRLEDVNGVGWPRWANDLVTLPYFVHGASGIGTVYLRLGTLFGREEFLRTAVEIGNSVATKWTVLPNLFDGLAGIGEYLLDLHRATGEDAWRERALDAAETVLWYRIEKPEGFAYPCRALTRIANDYALGAAGVGLFLHRAVAGGPRLFTDLAEPNGSSR
jgi:hypothetical protein